MKILSILLLVICSYTDIRERGISIRVLAVFIVSSAALMISTYMLGDRYGVIKRSLIYEPDPINILLSLLPGIILLIISFISREAIGRGDVYVVSLLGFMTGIDRILAILLISMLSCGIFGLAYMVMKGKSRKDTLPYVPFLLGAYILTMLINRTTGG